MVNRLARNADGYCSSRREKFMPDENLDLHKRIKCTNSGKTCVDEKIKCKNDAQQSINVLWAPYYI